MLFNPFVCHRITSSTKKFVKEYNRFLRAQDDVKRQGTIYPFFWLLKVSNAKISFSKRCFEKSVGQKLVFRSWEPNWVRIFLEMKAMTGKQTSRLWAMKRKMVGIWEVLLICKMSCTILLQCPGKDIMWNNSILPKNLFKMVLIRLCLN